MGMKTNTNRIQRNHGRKSVKTQVKTIGNGRAGKNATPIRSLLQVHNDDELSLILFSSRQGTSIAELPLTSGDFAAIKRQADNAYGSFEEILGDGLNRMMREVPTHELEDAVAQSNALLELLHINMDWQAHRGGSEWDSESESVNHLNHGIGLLVDATKARLRNSFKATFSALHPKRQEVAS